MLIVRVQKTRCDCKSSHHLLRHALIQDFQQKAQSLFCASAVWSAVCSALSGGSLQLLHLYQQEYASHIVETRCAGFDWALVIPCSINRRSRGQAIPMSLKFGAEVEEGLVPGLDMCNHASPAPARWNLDAVCLCLSFYIIATTVPPGCF